MILIFDTETSGFITPNYPPNHPQQGRILQIAALLIDETWKEVGSLYTLIDIPDHVEIHAKAFEAHNISKEACKKYGIPIEAALINLAAFALKADVAVGHNISFDKDFVAFEEQIIYGGQITKFKKEFCTMNETTPICKIPSKRGGFKWPKLNEAYEFFFSEKFDKAHDALADVRATARIYKYMFENNLIAPVNIENVNFAVVQK